MKSIINIILAVFILFQGMFSYVDIIFQIDELFEDYQIHQVKYGDDFTTFISKHFGDLRLEHQKQHQKEHQNHKHHNSTEINMHFHYICFKDFDEIPLKSEILSKENNFSFKNLFSSFEKEKIFQPPRLS